MANKKHAKDRKKKGKEYAPTASSFAEEAVGRMQTEVPASAANTAVTTAAHAGTAYTELSRQLAQPQQPVDTSSPLRLVPIYDLNHLPIDWTTGDRFIPRLDKSTAALQNVRLIPIYRENQLPNTSAQQSSTNVVAAQENVQRAKDNGGTAGTSLQPEAASSNLQQNPNPSTTTDVLELRGNTNTKVQFILPEGLPSMVPALGGVRRGPGTKIVLEGNEDAQICMVPRDSVEPSPLTSGEEITIKGNKKMQLFSGGGGGGESSENNASDSTDESNGTSDEIAQGQASVHVNNNDACQIMGLPSSGAAASSSNISNNQQCQIMNVPALAPLRAPTNQPYAAPLAPNMSPPGQPQATNRREASGTWNFSQGFNSLGLKINQFRERVWQVNENLKSFAGSVNSRITLSKPTATDGFPRLKKRCILMCAMSSDDKQGCVVDVYESRLRIRSISEDNPLQVELSYSDIKGITSNSSKHLELTDQDNKVMYISSEDSTADDILDIVSGIVSAAYSVFPLVPFQSLFPTFKISPVDRYDIAFGPYKNSLQRHESSVAQSVDSVLPEVRTFSLADFYRQFPNGDLGLLRALKYSKWYIRFNADNKHVTPACVECIAEILEHNTTLEVIDFSQSRLKPSSIHKLGLALSKNPSSKVVEINFSNNTFSNQDVAALSSALAMPNRGFRRLFLEKTGMTARMTNELLRGIHNNVYATTLSCLNLSGLKSDLWTHFRRNHSIQSVGVFLGAPNQLQELNLSGGGMVLEEIVDSLATGCLSHLRLLDLSGNYYSLASSKPVPLKWKRFFSEAQSIDVIGLSNTRLPANAFQIIFEGLSENKFVAERYKGVILDVSKNNLGLKGAEVLAVMAGQMQNIRSLDVTRNGLKNGLSRIFESYATNGGVNELLIGKNFTFLTQHKTFQKIGVTIPRILDEDARKKEQAIESLIQMIKSKKSVVTSLDLTGSNLGTETLRIINALKENKRISKLNISGNAMGDDGATALADVLLSTTVLKSIALDRNNLSISGLEKIAQVLWRNPSVKEVVLPSVDISTAHWEDHEKALELTGIFQLKTCSASDLQPNVYCHLQNCSVQSHEDTEYAEYAEDTEGTGDIAIPSSSDRELENVRMRIGFQDADLKEHKENASIYQKETTNLRTLTAEGSSTQTIAIVHVESEGQSNELSPDNQQVTSPHGESTSAPVLPEKRSQIRLSSSRPDVLLQHKKESASSSAFSDSREKRPATSNETSRKHIDSPFGASGFEEQLMKPADHQPSRLPHLGTEEHSSVTRHEVQSTVPSQRKPTTPTRVLPRTHNVQQPDLGREPWVTSMKPQDSASVTSGDKTEVKNEAFYENLMKTNESDNVQKSSVPEDVGVDSSSLKHVTELQNEEENLKIHVEVEAKYSAVHAGEPKKAPVKPAKPSQRTKSQIDSGTAFTASLSGQSTEKMAAEKNSEHESMDKPTNDHDKSF